MLEAAGLNTRELLEGQVEGGEEVGVGDAVLGHHVLDFWLCICLCHNLIVQNDPQTGQPLYQVSLGGSVHGHHFDLFTWQLLL